MDTNEELVKMIDQANDAVWFPVAIVGTLLGFIIFLLSYIWKKSEARNEERHKEHEKRHDDNEKIIAEIKENTMTQAAINERLKTLVERNIEDIRDLKHGK